MRRWTTHQGGHDGPVKVPFISGLAPAQQAFILGEALAVTPGVELEQRPRLEEPCVLRPAGVDAQELVLE
jgi:hypothetical protein